jgi:hypothetical protein
MSRVTILLSTYKQHLINNNHDNKTNVFYGDSYPLQLCGLQLLCHSAMDAACWYRKAANSLDRRKLHSHLVSLARSLVSHQVRH